MPAMDEILKELAKPVAESRYGGSQFSAFEAAPLLSQALVRFQKEQRAQPTATELQDLSGEYAKTPAAQQSQLNSRANALRQNYLQSGGSAFDLPKNLWGSDPNKGFQTGLGQFVPGVPGDNLSFGQKLKLAPIAGMYEGKPTWERQYQQRALDIQNKTADANILNAKNDNALAREKLDYDKIMDVFKLGGERQKSADKQLQDAKDNVYKAFDSLENYDEYGNKTTPMDPKIKSNLKAWYNNEITDLLKSPNPRETLEAAKDDILKEYGDWTGSHILNALETTLGAYNPK